MRLFVDVALERERADRLDEARTLVAAIQAGVFGQVQALKALERQAGGRSGGGGLAGQLQELLRSLPASRR